MKITIQHYDIEITTELPDDSELSYVQMTIEGMLIGVGFPSVNVKKTAK